MSYIPPPLAPREAFDSDEAWYRYNRAQLEKARSKMPTVMSGVASVLLTAMAVVLLWLMSR